MTTLIDLDDLKTDLGIEGTSEDSLLTRLSALAGEVIEKHVGYPIERSTHIYTVTERDRLRTLTIPFYPVHAVTKVTVDGVVWIDEDDPDIETPADWRFTQWGALYAPGYRRFCGEIEVELESGYYLADDAGPPAVTRDLPLAFELASAEIVKDVRAERLREPGVKSEQIPGVMSVTYERAIRGMGELPDTATRFLAPYRAVRVG